MQGKTPGQRRNRPGRPKKPPMAERQWFSVEDVTGLLGGVSREAVLYLVRSGKLPCDMRTERGYRRFARADVIGLLVARCQWEALKRLGWERVYLLVGIDPAMVSAVRARLWDTKVEAVQTFVDAGEYLQRFCPVGLAVHFSERARCVTMLQWLRQVRPWMHLTALAYEDELGQEDRADLYCDQVIQPPWTVEALTWAILDGDKGGRRAGGPGAAAEEEGGPVVEEEV